MTCFEKEWRYSILSRSDTFQMNPWRRRDSRRTHTIVVLAIAAAIQLALAGCEKQAPTEQWSELPPEVQVEIANTPELRERGLMFRQHLPKNHGMYFIFEEEQHLSFYMRDTRIPLSIAFIASDGIIESIKDMIPLDERSVSSAGPARFALEVNRGWFDENGIRPGDRVVLEGNSVQFFREIYR